MYSMEELTLRLFNGVLLYKKQTIVNLFFKEIKMR